MKREVGKRERKTDLKREGLRIFDLKSLEEWVRGKKERKREQERERFIREVIWGEGKQEKGRKRRREGVK